MYKVKKKMLISVFVLALVVLCSCFVGKLNSKVLASETDSISQEKLSVLSVKCQVKKNTDGSADLRLVSTVDELEAYGTAGFDIYIDGSEESIRYERPYVKERIEAKTDGVPFEYNPKVFDTTSKYFITVTITGIPKDDFGVGFLIKPFVTEVDNADTRLYGESRYVQLNDVYGTDRILSVPVSKLSETSGLSVKVGDTTYSDTQVEIYNSANDDNYTHARINIGSTGLSSLTKVSVLNSASEEVANTTYRNLHSTSSTPDKSWYDNADANDTEYVVVTKADLYGLASVVNGGNNLKDKTVYLGADIVINKDVVLDPAEYESNDAWTAAVAQCDKWAPIGQLETTSFAGTFDGQGQNISGLYLNSPNFFLGLFGVLDKSGCSVVRNFTLTNSYLESTRNASSDENAGLGSIAGQGAGVLDSIHSDAILVSADDNAGGFVGSHYYSGTLSVENCWFSGKVTGASWIGGIVGFVHGNVINASGVGDGTRISDCLVSGDLSGTQNIGGLTGRANGGMFASCVVTGTITGTGTAGLINGILGQSVTLVNNYSDNKLVMAKCYYTTGRTTSHYSTVVSGTAIAATTSQVVKKAESDLQGANAYANTELDFYVEGVNEEGRWVAIKDNGLPELKSFAEEDTIADISTTKRIVTADIAWYEGGRDTIYTAAELFGMASICNAGTDTFVGKTIKLGSDIKVNIGKADEWETADGSSLASWTPIGGVVNGTERQFAGTFNGQGYTISGLYAKSEVNCLGLFGMMRPTSATVMDLRLVNTYFERTGGLNNDACGLGSIVGRGDGTLNTIYSDAILKSPYNNTGGLVGSHFTKDCNLTVTNCWFDGEVSGVNFVGGLVGFEHSQTGTTTMEDCLVTADIVGTQYIGGIAGRVTNGSFTSCMVAGDITGTSYVAGLVGYSLSQASLSETFTMTNCFNATNIELNNIYNTDHVAPTLNNVQYVADEELLYGTDGYSEYLHIMDFYDVNSNDDGKWVVVENKLPELRSFTKAEYMHDLSEFRPVVADTSWYNTTDKEFTISTAGELYGLASICNAGTDTFVGKTIKLGSDIKVNNGTAADWATTAPMNTWTPIGGAQDDTKYQFAGTFDGQGHTISGIYLKSGELYLGLFGVLGTTGNASIQNLRLTNSYFECTATSRSGEVHGLGSIAGQGAGTLNNVYSDAILVNGSTNTGGLVGSVVQTGVTLNVTNCWFTGSVTGGVQDTTASYDWVGGLVGFSTNGVTINMTNCLVAADLSSKLSTGTSFVGGLNGRTVYGQIQSCTVFGDISYVTPGYARSVVGMTTNNTLTITQCCNATNTADIYYNVTPATVDVSRFTDCGDGNYNLEKTGTTYDDYQTYCTTLVSNGFTKYAENVLDGVEGDTTSGVWNATYKKEEIVITVIHKAKEGKTYISIGKDLPLSEHLVYQATYLEGNGANAKTTLYMPELYDYGDSFIIRLKNGHFLLADGGASYDAPYLLKYLESLTNGKKPVIEGWFISHGHGDHNGVLMAFVDNPTYADRIYVEGVYFSQPSSAVGTSSDWAQVQKGVSGVQNCRTTSGEVTPIYRPQTGQRYYFNDITVDVLHTQEQLAIADYGYNYDETDGDMFNDSSTWIMYTIEEQTFLHAGDAAEGSIQVVMNSYNQAYLDFDVMATFHHGQNVYAGEGTLVKTIDYVNYFNYKTVLYTTFVTASQTAGNRESENNKLQQNATNNGGEYMCWGDGTKILTFPYEVGSFESLSPREEWTYHPGYVPNRTQK